MPQLPAAGLYRILRAVFVAILSLTAFPVSISAQLGGRLLEKPLGVTYLRNVTQERTLRYAKSLSERLEIGKESIQSVDPEQANRTQSAEIQEPVNGAAIYLVQGVVPSMAAVSFQQVASAADAKTVLQGMKDQWGPKAELTENSDTTFLLKTSFNSKSEIPEGADESQYTGNNHSSRGLKNTVSIVEESGKKYVIYDYVRMNWLRFHDNLLFSSDFEELWTMKLPSAAELTGSVDMTTDMGLLANFDEVPPGIKQLGWNVLNSGVVTQLQQRDGEETASYDLRRSFGDLGLSAARAVMFDIDTAKAWLRFADEQQRSVSGELAFQARRNSKITTQLDGLASGRSRFAGILNDGAAATLHICAQLPDDSSPLIQAAGTWLEQSLAAGIPGNNSATTAKSIADSLRGIAEHRVVELIVKIGWTKASDGVIYGGVQLNDNPRLIPELYALLTSLTDLPPEVRKGISLTQEAGSPMIVISLPGGSEAAKPGSSDAAPAAFDARGAITAFGGLKISHLYLTQQNSCLWFAIGTEKAIEIVRQSTQGTGSGRTSGRTPLLSVTADMKKWMSYPQDDPSGIAAWPNWLDQNSHQFPPLNPLIGESQLHVDPPVALLQRVFELGGDQDVSLVLNADAGGVVLRLKMGEAIANYYSARIISLQDAQVARNSGAAIRKETEKRNDKQSTAP